MKVHNRSIISSRSIAGMLAILTSQALFHATIARAAISAPEIIVNTQNNPNLPPSFNGYNYAYAPSIIYTQGQYHAYFCSNPGAVSDWDWIRHETSTDLVHWSAPDVQLVPSNHSTELSNCDPSVVLYDANDGAGPMYYMFYGGNYFGVEEGDMFVARSKLPTGPFMKYTVRGTWEINPADPQIIIHTMTPTTNTAIYGAGQPTVVVLNGKLYMWHMDNSKYLNNSDYTPRIFLRTTTSPVSWSAATETNVLNNQSVDVKYDSVHQQFVMFELENFQAVNSEFAIRISKDGITWTAPDVLSNSNVFPHWAHNIGVSSDDKGHLMGGKMVIAYGADYGLSSTDNWGHWDLYGNILNFWDLYGSDLHLVFQNQTASGFTEFHTLSAGSNYSQITSKVVTGIQTFASGVAQYLFGGYTGGFKPDLFTILSSGTGSKKTEVHILSSGSAYKTFAEHIATPFPVVAAGVAQFQLGNYSGGQKPDLFILQTAQTGSGNAEVHILSGDSRYQTWVAHFATPCSLASAGCAQARYLLGNYTIGNDPSSLGFHKPDLFIVVPKNSNGFTEVHVLSGDSNYQTWVAHILTPFQPAANQEVQFSLGAYTGGKASDLYIDVLNGTKSGKQEQHILYGDSDYQSWVAHLVLPETPSSLSIEQAVTQD